MTTPESGREPSEMVETFRVGRKVPRNVYRGDHPLFMAASDEEAAQLVRLLNAGVAALGAGQAEEEG